MASDAAPRPTLVTVAIPTRDRWEWASRAVASALAQRGVDVEAVVVDDGSLEPSPPDPVLHDGRVRIVRHDSPRGVAAARNRALAEAGTEWVAFLDDDDFWSPDKLRAQISAAEAAGAAFAYGGAYVVDPALHVLKSVPSPAPDGLPATLVEANEIPAGASNVVVRAERLRDVGGFDEHFGQLADWDLWLRLGEAAPAAAVGRPLVAYVHHPDNMASTRPRTLYREWDRLRRKHRELARRHGRRFRSGDFLLWYVSRHRLAGRRARGVAAALEGGLRYGRPLTAARCTVRAMRAAPEAREQTDGEEPRAWLREAQGSWL